MTHVTHRYENFRRNGMRGGARSQPRMPWPFRLIEYLAFSLLCLAGLFAVAVLMALVALSGLDRQSEPPAR